MFETMIPASLMPEGWTPATLGLAGAVFLLAGIIKGITGAGLPTVALALLTLIVDIRAAVTVLVVPALMTNIWQGIAGGAFVSIARRLTGLLAAAAIGIGIGAQILATGDAKFLAGILGLVLIFYSGYSLATPQIPAPPRPVERWLSPSIGLTTGVLFGFTGSFLVPGVVYIQALGFKRDHFVQATGIALAFANIVLWIFLAGQGLFTLRFGLVSAVLCVPAMIGMVIGQRLRKNLSEDIFRRAFFVTLMLLSAYIAAGAFL